jgi:hypothetical protein
MGLSGDKWHSGKCREHEPQTEGDKGQGFTPPVPSEVRTLPSIKLSQPFEVYEATL